MHPLKIKMYFKSETQSEATWVRKVLTLRSYLEQPRRHASRAENSKVYAKLTGTWSANNEAKLNKRIRMR